MKLIALDHYDMVRRGELELSKLASFASRYGATPLSDKELNRLEDSDFGLVLIASDGSRSRVFPLVNQFEVLMSKAGSISNSKDIPGGALNILDARLEAAGRRYLPGAFYKTARAEKTPGSVYLLSGEDELRMAQSNGIKKEASSGHFAITESINGNSMQRFPIDNEEQLRRRINRFDTARDSMHVKYAFQYARNVSERANELGVKIPEDSPLLLFKVAALNPMATKHINNRIKYAPDVAQREYIGLMLKTASATPEQISVSLDAIDRKYGMDEHYGVHYPSATDSALSMHKKAEVFTIGGTEIDRDDIMGLLSSNEPEFVESFGAETIEAMKKDPESVINSLPIPFRQKLMERLNNTSS